MKKNIVSKEVLGSFFGGAIEMYDLTIFGILAPMMANYFFPFNSLLESLLITYGAFAVGLMARPLGSVIFGVLGDKYGRKTAFVASLILMSIATLMIGLCPGYAILGMAAPLILLLCRILQGFSAGGEHTGGMVFAIEHGSQSKRTGMIGALVSSGSILGVIMGSFTGILCQVYSEQFPWIWRLPFILGFCATLVGIYIRLRLEETPVFLKTKEASLKQLSTLSFKNRDLILTSILLSSFAGAAFYFYFINFHSILSSVSGLSVISARIATFIGSCMLLLGALYFGNLSDKVDRIQLMKLGVVLTFLTYMALITEVLHINQQMVFVLILLYACSLSMFTGPFNTLIVELFPPNIRYSCASVSYSLGVGIVGGLTPLVTTYLSSLTFNFLYLGGYFLTISLGAYLALAYLQLRHSATLNGDYQHITLPSAIAEAT